MDIYEALIKQGFSIILFCIGVTLLFMNYNRYMEALGSVREINQEQIIYYQAKEVDERLITRGELISYLLHQLEYDIEIDGLLITRIDNIRGNIQNYEFHSDYYKKGYRYQEDGTIKSIVFFGV